MIRLLSRVIFMALFIPVIGMSQTAAQTSAGQTGKVVWLDTERAVFSCDEGQTEFAGIQQWVDAKNAEMTTLKNEFGSLQNQLNVQGAKLTDEARADLQYQITVKNTQLERFQQDTQLELNAKKERTGAYIFNRMQPVIEKVAKDKGFGAVINFDPQRDIWIDETLNVTEEIVKAYNATYPVSKAKPSTPSTTAP